MLAARAVTSVNRCGSCHLALLKSITSLAGAPLDLQSLLSAARRRTNTTRCVEHPRALFSTSLRRTLDALSGSRGDSVAGDGSGNSAEGVDAKYPSATSATHIPWYLQVDTPQAPAYPISDRQRLPDMPVDPPPILEPLLKYVSIDLGLDDLSLFDLRKLDPPPALGSKLLMILGTARSERHLHVSADRLCRWLRSTYRLTPFADGLLGRNELKLKLRRKARRAKLLGSVGTSASNNADDGVRTGWVCVNVGTVESGKVSQEDPAATTEIVGFGSRNTGVNIVIQMLTEEKRGELDLEELWGATLEEQVASPAVTIAHAQELPGGTEFGLATPVRPSMASSHSQTTGSSHPQLTLSSQTQLRALHSERKLFNHDGSDENIDQFPGLDSPSVELISQNMTNKIIPDQAAAPSSTKTRDRNIVHWAVTNSWDKLSPEDHLIYLRTLTQEEALKALGQDMNDSTSTSFLKSFYTKRSESTEQRRWRAKLNLLLYAVELGHRGDPKWSLAQMLGQIQATSSRVAPNILMQMLRMILLPNGFSHAPGQQGVAIASLSPTSLTASVDVLAEISRRKYRYLPEDIAIMLQMVTGDVMPFHGLAGAESAKVDATRDSHDSMTAQQRLSHLMATFSVEPTSEAQTINTLRRYAKPGKWEQFWFIWRKHARRMPRSGALYAVMFRAIAKEKNKIVCSRILRKWVPEMDTEDPPVKFEGEVAKAVKDCLLVVHPNMEEDARKEPDATGEWVPLWLRCALALHESSGSGLEV